MVQVANGSRAATLLCEERRGRPFLTSSLPTS
jgi:hypothetical protein